MCNVQNVYILLTYSSLIVLLRGSYMHHLLYKYIYVVLDE